MIRAYHVGLLLVCHKDKNVRSQRTSPLLGWGFTSPGFATEAVKSKVAFLDSFEFYIEVSNLRLCEFLAGHHSESQAIFHNRRKEAFCFVWTR